MRAIQIDRFGGPEVLKVAEVEEPRPGPNSVLVEASFAGVNFTDCNHRAGIRSGALPVVPGIEGAGRVARLGKGVKGLAVGDRVAWKAAPRSYASRVIVSASEAVVIPEDISEEIAAAAILQGLTAQYLATSTFPIAPGESVLVHAGAGGVGLCLIQFLTAAGVRVLTTTSSEEKAHLAEEAGAEVVIRYDAVDFAPVVRELTGGEGVSVVYDGVGKTTFDGSFASLAPLGCLVLYGTASGPVEPLDLARLGAGSLYVTRPSLPNYTRTRDELDRRAAALFGAIKNGAMRIHIGARLPLEEASKAHELLESRRSSGKVVLEVANG